MTQLVAAIAPVRDRTPLTAGDRQIIADVLSWDIQQEVSPDEVVTIAINHDILWVKLTGNRAIPIAVDTFRSIRRQQLEQQGQETQPADIEVDSNGQGVYRAWKSTQIIGVFHRSPVDGKWIAYPAYASDFQRYQTPEQAQRSIVRAWQKATEVRSCDKAAVFSLGGSHE